MHLLSELVVLVASTLLGYVHTYQLGLEKEYNSFLSAVEKKELSEKKRYKTTLSAFSLYLITKKR